MPVSYALPPWIGRPADPAAHYAQGFQIGVHLGAQQAAQMFQQQQMAMQHQKELMAEQQQEVENQYNTQVLNLKAAELARKHQANQIFQSRIASGEDPSQVLMQLAPELGESATSVLHNQALREQARANMALREAQFGGLMDTRTERAQERRDSLTERQREFEENKARKAEEAAQKKQENAVRAGQARSRLLLTASKDPELTKINEELAKAKAYRADVLASPHWWKSKPETITKAIEQLESDRSKRLKDLGIELGEDIPTGTVQSVGDNTMPDQPTAPSRRLRFDGKGFQEVQ